MQWRCDEEGINQLRSLCARLVEDSRGGHAATPSDGLLLRGARGLHEAGGQQQPHELIRAESELLVGRYELRRDLSKGAAGDGRVLCLWLSDGLRRRLRGAIGVGVARRRTHAVEPHTQPQFVRAVRVRRRQQPQRLHIVRVGSVERRANVCVRGGLEMGRGLAEFAVFMKLLRGRGQAVRPGQRGFGGTARKSGRVGRA